MIRLVVILTLVFAFACSNDEIYTRENLYNMGTKVDPNLKIVLPKDLASGVKCSNYGEGCIRGFEVQHRELSMIFVEYEKPEQAQKFAETVNAYVTRNWLIDDVYGEPVLEDFVKKALKARLVLIKKP